MPVGRLIFTVNALPTVRPMNFALVEGLIALRTAASTTVARRADGMIVAFQADELEAATSSGWSVTVTGWPTGAAIAGREIRDGRATCTAASEPGPTRPEDRHSSACQIGQAPRTRSRRLAQLP